MKTIKFFGMLIAALTLSFTTTSCGSDDVEDVIENGGKASTELKTSDNEIVLTIKQPAAYTMVTTAKFSNKQCTSYVIKTTYATDVLADAAWKSAQADNDEEGMTYKRDGKTITADGTGAMKGMSYDIVLQIMQKQKQAFENANNALGK